MKMAKKKASEPEVCSVEGCSDKAERSVSTQKIKKALSDLSVPDKRRSKLCKEHYKQFRKATKKDRELDRLGW